MGREQEQPAQPRGQHQERTRDQVVAEEVSQHGASSLSYRRCGECALRVRLHFMRVRRFCMWIPLKQANSRDSTTRAPRDGYDSGHGPLPSPQPGADPLLTLDDAGRVVRRQEPPASGRSRPTRLGVLAYRARDQRLVTADVPFWFFRLKGPAAQFAVRGTGLDLERLQITPADLERHGPAVVIDHTNRDGDRLLVWAE